MWLPRIVAIFDEGQKHFGSDLRVLCIEISDFWMASPTMIALAILIVLAVWSVLGMFVFARLTTTMRSPVRRRAAGIFFALIWLLVPFADELVGSLTFKQYCRQLPMIETVQRVEVGPGVFYDELGRPKWKDRVELSDPSTQFGRALNDLINVRSDKAVLAGPPFPITKRTSIFFDARSGAKIYEYIQLHSYGGTLKRFTQLGYMLEYTCDSPGDRPQIDEQIAYRADAPSESKN